MSGEPPEFRLGSILATSFTATLTERRGASLERIPTPRRLADWLSITGLAVGACTAAELAAARELREAIHTAATAVAIGEPLPGAAIQRINECSARGRGTPELTLEGGRRWRLGDDCAFEDALGVIAADAIDIVSGERDGKMSLCAAPSCRAAFFDTSRSRTRRWCDMNTCGNREKKARFHANRRAETAVSTPSSHRTAEEIP